MLKFILRRFASSVIVLLVASVLLFVLVINAGDPLEDLRESRARNRDYLMEKRIEYMGLDQPWYLRYFSWLRGAAGCIIGQCDLGRDRTGVAVNTLLAQAASSTLRLVFIATLIALVLGIAIGILTAIRQYSGLDYTVTFLMFLFFSLPVFWAAVLLKDYLAIGYNDWIADPQIPPATLILLALFAGFVMQVFLAGSIRRRVLTFLTTAVVIGGGLAIMLNVDYFRTPQLGVIGVAVLTIAIALGGTAMTVGLPTKEVLIPAGITAGLVIVMQFALTNVFIYYMNAAIFIGGALLAIVVPLFIGRHFGGRHKATAIGVSIATGLGGAALTVMDYIFRSWPGFLDLKPRPISTVGSQTPNFRGDFWETFLDFSSQLLLPTLLLALISLASYGRYTRASMLEVSRQDYIRTARAKGAPDRVVIFRHAFRNALIPIATIAAFDFAGLIGGAVITERIFGWKGMGALFATGLDLSDPAPVMAFFLVTGTAAIFFNLLADIFYAIIDPRIRV